MDLRDINELGFAAFGQLLDGKADFRILQTEGILNNFSRENLEKVFQLPYGLDINAGKEYLSFVKLLVQLGKYGPVEKYIFVTGYKYAGVDTNKRKNYYGGCVAFKYEGSVIEPAEILNYLTMILDLSKSLIIDNLPLPLKLQQFKGVKKEISFNGLSTKNHFVISTSQVNDDIKTKFLEYNYNNTGRIAPVHRFILALGSERIQGINSFEIKAIEAGFDKIADGSIDLFTDCGIKLIETSETENNRIMAENKNDSRIDEALNDRLKPVFEKLDTIEKKIEESKSGINTRNSVKSIDKVFLSLIIVLLVVLFFILKEVVLINIVTQPAAQMPDSRTVKEIEKLVSKRLDSLNQAAKEKQIIYVAGKNDNISKVAEMYKVSPEQIINKNSVIKAGDTLIIKK